MQRGLAAPLTPDALADNRAGKLTAAQSKVYRGMSRGWRKSEFQFAAVFAVIGLLVWFAEGPARYATVKPLVGIGFLIVAGLLALVGLTGADPITRDIREGRVAQAEGAIRKYTENSHSGNSSNTYHYAEVGDVRTEMGPTAYDALPEAGIVRLYYLPRSRRLVNFEQLDDRPLPEGALTDPHVALKAAVSGLFGNAEARAEVAAIGRDLTASGAPPPAAQRDARPLSEAIVGTWRNPMLSVTFGADGSVEATMFGGMKRTGRWSVDGSGRLLTDVTGTEGGADAWVAGERLSIELDGQGLTLVRS